jgi:Sulfotransferase family
MKIERHKRSRTPCIKLVLPIGVAAGIALVTCYLILLFLGSGSGVHHKRTRQGDPKDDVVGDTPLGRRQRDRTTAVVDNSNAAPVDSISERGVGTGGGGGDGGALIHTGKTGGSTISVLLRHGCHSFMPHPCRTDEELPHESMASKRIESYYHVPDFGRLPQSHHAFYVVMSRDPLDRMISAFVFDHVRNRYARNETVDPFKVQKYQDAYVCFPTLQRFVDLLGDDPHHFSYPHKQNWVSAESCPDLAKAAIHSRVKIYNHLYFSYQKLLSFVPTIHQQTLYAIRQEYLWPDWKSLNVVLGQTEPVYVPENDKDRMIRNVTQMEAAHAMPVTRELDAVGTVRLCQALRGEYRGYLWLLKRAKNLSPHDVDQSIAYAKRQCPSLDIDEIARNVS